MATTSYITIHAGTTVQLTFSITESSVNKSLTGATSITYTIDTPTKIEKTLSSGIAISAAPNNHQCVVTLSPSDTTGVRADRYNHQLEIVDSSGNRSVCVTGQVTIKENI